MPRVSPASVRRFNDGFMLEIDRRKSKPCSKSCTGIKTSAVLCLTRKIYHHSFVRLGSCTVEAITRSVYIFSSEGFDFPSVDLGFDSEF